MSEIRVDTISEKTSANGVAIDSVTLKDGGITATAASTITVADNSDTLTLTSTDADAAVGPNLKLFRNSSSPAADDLLGAISFAGEDAGGNDTEYALIDTVIGATTDGSENGRIRMKIQKAGTLSSGLDINADAIIINDDSKDIDFRVEGSGQTHALFVDAGNDCVGICTSSPSPYKLEVSSGVNNTGIAHFEHTHATPEGIAITFSAAAPDDTSAQFLECTDNSAQRLRIQSDGDVYNHDNSYGSLSDERVKEQIKDSGSQWDDLKNMKIRKFKFKSDVADKGDSDDLWRLGVVAQELEASSMNGLVNDEVKDGETITQYKTVKYSILYMKAIKALQEAMARIEALESK